MSEKPKLKDMLLQNNRPVHFKNVSHKTGDLRD